MKENDGLEAVLAALDKLQNDLCSTEPGHLVEAYEAFETIRNYITGGNGMTASRPVDAALKSPPEIEGEYTLEGNSAAFVYVCQDGKKIATVYGSGEEKLERGYTIINALNAALPHCPDGLRLAQLVLQIDKAAREEGLYIGGGYNPKLAKSEQEGPMWKAIKELAGLIAAAEGNK